MTKLYYYIINAFQLLLFSSLFVSATAQHNCKLIIHPVSIDSSTIISLNLQTIFNTKVSCIQYVNQLPSLLAIKGFAAASIDSVWEDSSSVSINLFVGEKYEWQKLFVNDSNKTLLSSLGYSAENFTKQDFSAVKLQQLYDDVINYQRI